MNKMLKLFALALCLALFLSACAAEPQPEAPEEPEAEQTEETQTGMPNPFVTVASYEELVAACEGLAIAYPPEGATNINYSYCVEDEKVYFAQIDFSYEEDSYQYRCRFAASEAEAEEMLHGLYYDFTDEQTVSEGLGHEALLRADKEGDGVATWYSALSQCQYSLTTKTSQDPATVLMKVLPLLNAPDSGM